MKKNNPFVTSFGKEPESFISRRDEEESIIDVLDAELPTQQAFMITGVRGSGKTALLTRIKRELSEDKRWIIVELNPNGDLLNDLISKLCDEPLLRAQFVKAKINLSLFGVSLGLENIAPINSTGTALDKMLKVVKKLDKRLLITIDEANNNKDMRTFASEFQMLLRENYPVYLVMTGLFKNIYDLQNEKTLTFLYRAPKIVLGRLNNTAIINSYKKIFGISCAEAGEMAAKVKGFAFAYQLYGSLYFENKINKSKKDIDTMYDETLGELVYEKLWSELSTKDKEIMSVIASHGDSPVRTGEIVSEYNQKYPAGTKMSDKLMSVYRERLKREGLIESPKYGYIQIGLPRLDAYIDEYGVI